MWNDEPKYEEGIKNIQIKYGIITNITNTIWNTVCTCDADLRLFRDWASPVDGDDSAAEVLLRPAMDLGLSNKTILNTSIIYWEPA